MNVRLLFKVCLSGVLFLFPVTLQSQVPSANPDALFLESVRLQRAGKYEEARSTLRGLLDRFPAYHDARLLYGRLLAWDEEYQAAMVQLDSVLFYQPTNAEVRFTKAQVLAWSGRYRQAADILLVLCDEDPGSVIYRAELAKVYLWGGSPRRALTQYEQAYLSDPNSVDVLRGLARTHRQLRSYDLGKYWYEKLLERVPGDSEAQAEILQMTYRSDVEIQLQGSYEGFTRSGVKAHTLGQLEIYGSPNEDWKPYLHLSRVEKYSETDLRYGLGTYVTLGYSVGLQVQGIVSPKAHVAPRLDLLGELTGGVMDGLELIGGYRYMEFDTSHIHVIQPGATWYIDRASWLTIKAYVGLRSPEATSTAFTTTFFYALDPLTIFRLGVFTGTEAFRATSALELSSWKTQGLFTSLKSRISRPVALELMYQYTSRTVPAHSHLVLLTASLLL